MSVNTRKKNYLLEFFVTATGFPELALLPTLVTEGISRQTFKTWFSVKCAEITLVIGLCGRSCFDGR